MSPRECAQGHKPEVRLPPTLDQGLRRSGPEGPLDGLGRQMAMVSQNESVILTLS